MRQIFLITLEPLEKRYTAQWKHWLKADFQSIPDVEVVEIDGKTVGIEPNPGSFFDWTATNSWKSEQIQVISELFRAGKVRSGDVFFFYDAWHYGVIALKYMSVLSKIPVKIAGIWHAGAYDSSDILGREGLFQYFQGFETSCFECLDASFVATSYHKSVILKSLSVDPSRIHVTGLPFRLSDLDSYRKPFRERRIAFPHRLSNDKQPRIFYDLADLLQEKYGIGRFVSQEMSLSKEDYYDQLSRCRFLFSCSLHENWGISIFEGLAMGVIPVLPDRLSYSEMYPGLKLYPSEWTESWESYLRHRKDLASFISSFGDMLPDHLVISLRQHLEDNYCTSRKIIDTIGRML